MPNLSAKQQRFIEEYLLDLNATKAALRAGYSPRTARQAGAENLSKPVILAEIAERTRALAERNGVSLDAFIQDLRERVHADVSDIFDADGNLLPPEQWPPVWRRGLVTRLKVEEKNLSGNLTRRTISIRFADRTPLKYLLGRHLGAFK
jgi:phage terminase small subunit